MQNFISFSQTLQAVSATTLNDLKEEAANYSVIGIDEGQFVSFNKNSICPYIFILGFIIPFSGSVLIMNYCW